jgi:hypothetical protein
MVVHNAYGEQVGHQHNQMDFDLNIEAVVEGNDQDFEAFQEQPEMGQDHDHHKEPEVEPQEEIDLNAPG